MNKQSLYKILKPDQTIPKAIYHIGVDAGFFSEYNNMILFLVYCLENRLKFSLYSRDANFKIKKGWEDFFTSFCEEEKCILHSFINQRPDKRYKLLLLNELNKIIIYLGHRIFTNSYLMADIWDQVRSLNADKQYSFPSLGISGDLRAICRELIKLTWVYSDETKEKSNALIHSLNLPSEYIGLHIRGGDKFIEAEKQEIDIYMNKAISLSNCKSAFVLTDDYTVIEQLQKKYKEWKFYTLCGIEERGYYHKQFKKQSLSEKERKMINLFTSVDIISDSQLFIGTFSSNPGMYLGMRMHPSKTFSVDIPEWRIW